MKNWLKPFLVLCFLLMNIVIIHAQGPGDPCGDPLGGPDCPIDGGLTILIAAGVGLGAKRALKKNNYK